MELYEAIINDVLCYNLEQHVAFVVRIKAPAYQMFNENTDAEFKELDLTGVKLDVRYNEGKFTRFNLVCETKNSKSPYIVNLLVHYDLIEILKLNLIMAEVKKDLNESPENEAPYQVVTLDELEKSFAGSKLVNHRVGIGYELVAARI
ncbi:hypothetical protein ACTQ44_00785 [Ligilactobacillus ruminis]|uniref:hypothetical protein n=1 Tax=Ligilactobacillus ruminis TaxID=1623 RepID=UPI0014740D54|nr:hypothetical protein [Ligilactobacillus ruminis]NME31612.1 hypothetical protein [Ligilactobacillus ruminis]